MSRNECRYCHQWEPGRDDAYCSACGRLLLLLELEPESLVLISIIAPVKELRLRNESARGMHVDIEPRHRTPIPGIAFEQGTSLDIPANAELRVRVGVDAQKLPAGFQRVVEYVCIVDGDSRKQRTFALDIRSGPAPKLITSKVDFEHVAEGKSAERNVQVKNLGGTPLRIRDVRAEGSPQLRVQGEYGDRLVQPGETLSIPVIWETALGEAAPRESAVRIEFANHPDVLVIPAVAQTFRHRVELTPALARFQQALAKRDYTTSVRIENLGTTDIEVLSIESDQPWITVAARATRFTLLCPESALQKAVSPTIFARAFDFRVVCSPRELTEGKHRGNVTIRQHGHEPLVLPVELTVVKPKEYRDYIGIDFGTTNSVVAVLSDREKGGVALVKDAASGKELIPSVLVFDDSDTCKIGDAARNEADTAPDRTVRSIKRVMGYERDRTFFDRSYSAAQLASLIIGKLVQLAEEKLHADSGNGAHYDVRKAIITVPANFHDLQIRDVLEACAAAGLDTEEERVQRVEKQQSEQIGAAVSAGIILDEPSAAVLYYLDFLRNTRNSVEIANAIAREQGLKLLVFDYGGGTLDVAIASVTQVPTGGTGLRILANLGDNDIGGDHIDILVMKELLRRCRQESKFELDTTLVAGNFSDLERRRDAEGWSADVWRELLRIRAQWKDLAEHTKIRIAEKKQTPVDVRPDLIVRMQKGRLEQAPRGIRIQALSAEVVNNLLQPVVARSEELIRSALALAEVDSGDIDYILHTGRQSLLPQIRKCVRAMFPGIANDRDLLEEEHLKVCVAKGAALYGRMRSKLVVRGARILLLSDGRRLPHSYGVETFTNPIEPEFDEVIERGAQYPIERTKPYPPEMIPPTGYLNLKFYQNTGSGKAIVGNPHVSLIGEISIDAADTSGCDVTFAIGPNRTLRVFANGNPVTIEPARLREEESWTG
ncbi:MAG TPA: Hsp70 family protein [Thermoanaerobaculia bacterium]|nr:Hsp70 family protein [Thermoanaerobaculia bacterium]